MRKQIREKDEDQAKSLVTSSREGIDFNIHHQVKFLQVEFK